MSPVAALTVILQVFPAARAVEIPGHFTPSVPFAAPVVYVRSALVVAGATAVSLPVLQWPPIVRPDAVVRLA